MAANQPQAPDRTSDSTKSLSILIMDAEEKPAEPDSMKEQVVPHVAKNERSVSPNPSPDAATIGLPREAAGQSGPFGSGGDHTVFPPNVYAPQAQTFYYRGYENGTGEWDEYSPYINTEGLEINSPASQQQRLMYGFGSGSNSYNRGYMPSGFNQGSGLGSAPFSSIGANNRGFLSLENSKRHVRGSGPICSCNAPVDILCEQNRGPRASKPKSQIMADSCVENTKHNASTTKVLDESFNRPDFVTDYKDAKFFIIKSYSEDNVHKSIKYGVWASTPNGNRKLDAAYREAKEMHGGCPVFLFFSVNASAQFCGVAEMIGPVDFDKSLDYWQQDKWSGQFPVKWHMIKDVPNSQFRHIILENNDNKPVTNSRDTQEVKLEQGIELLNIFKNYETDMSILDDFEFYEDRQKAMQERKARQQASLIAVGVVGENENKSTVQIPSDFIKHMSKSFAQVVCLDEGSQEPTTLSERASPASDGSIGARAKLEGAMPAPVPSTQTR